MRHKMKDIRRVVIFFMYIVNFTIWIPNAATASENGAIQTWKVASHEALTPQALTTASQKEVAASRTLTVLASNGTQTSQETRKP